MSDLVIQTVLFIVGLSLLYFGAEWLVRGSGSLARAHGIRPVIIGLTVVAFGTSAPELVVSLLAAASRSEALAVGNVVGSNIANIGLILGLAAILRPLSVERAVIRREIPIMLIASLFFYGLAWSGMIYRVSGGILFLGLLAFLLYSARTAKGGPEASQAIGEEVGESSLNSSKLKDGLLILLGLAALVLGARLMVSSAVYLARTTGVSEGIIGLTMVAGGTSLPELATSIVAVLKKETDIGVGNIIGSNLFNILAVVGLVALVQPLPVEPGWLLLQFPVMLLFSLVLLPILVDHKISRWEGGLLLAAYFAFLAWLF